MGCSLEECLLARLAEVDGLVRAAFGLAEAGGLRPPEGDVSGPWTVGVLGGRVVLRVKVEGGRGPVPRLCVHVEAPGLSAAFDGPGEALRWVREHGVPQAAGQARRLLVDAVERGVDLHGLADWALASSVIDS